MSSQPVTVDVPDRLVELLGSPQAVAERMQTALVLDLLRQGEISQGRAAELLGITRWDILQLMVKHEIPSGPRTVEELQEDIEAARKMRTRR